MAGDIDTIGVAANHLALFEQLSARGWWADKADLARFCTAYAVKSGVAEGTMDAPVSGTKWALGNFDKTGDLRVVVRCVYSGDVPPGRLLQHLLDQGLQLVHGRVVDDFATPADLLATE